MRTTQERQWRHETRGQRRYSGDRGERLKTIREMGQKRETIREMGQTRETEERD